MNATEEELNSSDRLCIICREDMQAAKKLDCGHMFHFKCLKSWLERQQSCPTCRSPILAKPPSPPSSPVPHASPSSHNAQACRHSPPKESPILRYGHWNGHDDHLSSSFEYAPSQDHHALNEVGRKIEDLRRIQAQISSLIAEFDRFKAENEN